MRSLTTLLAVAIAMCLCGTAVASPMQPPGTTAPSTSSQQDIRNPDNRVAPGHPGQAPDTSASLSADAAVSGDTPRIVSSASSDSGLSAFLIVLISVGGVAAIAGTAVVATRAVHHHGLT